MLPLDRGIYLHFKKLCLLLYCLALLRSRLRSLKYRQSLHLDTESKKTEIQKEGRQKLSRVSRLADVRSEGWSQIQRQQKARFSRSYFGPCRVLVSHSVKPGLTAVFLSIYEFTVLQE
jgi:hypothetical protein